MSEIVDFLASKGIERLKEEWELTSPSLSLVWNAGYYEPIA